MIFDAPGRPGATWYEGQFSQGLPDGVVRVQRPGGKPRIRRFKAGSDAGAADAGSLQLLQF